MTEINLVGTDGVKFKVNFAPITSSRMNLLLKASGGYVDSDAQIEGILSTIELTPDVMKEAVTDEKEFDKLVKLAKGYRSSKDDTSKKAFAKLLVGSLTVDQLENNSLIHLRYVQIMALETTLSSEQLELIKSDITGEFWSNQDCFLIKSAGEFFRRKVTDYSK